VVVVAEVRRLAATRVPAIVAELRERDSIVLNLGEGRENKGQREE
jgi:hypothetical protein